MSACLAQVNFRLPRGVPVERRCAANSRATYVTSSSGKSTMARYAIMWSPYLWKKSFADFFYRGLHAHIEPCPLWTACPCQPNSNSNPRGDHLMAPGQLGLDSRRVRWWNACWVGVSRTDLVAEER